MTIYDVPGTVRTAFRIAITRRNIMSNFQAVGVYLFNRNVF